MDAETVIYRLEEAGTTLLCLPSKGTRPAGYGSGMPEPMREIATNYGWDQAKTRPPIPNAALISRMDEALAWLPLIPGDRFVLRRIVGARSLVSPLTERHLFSWTRVAAVVGADRKAVQRWHAQGIDILVAALNVRNFARGIDRHGQEMREEKPMMASGAKTRPLVFVSGG